MRLLFYVEYRMDNDKLLSVAKDAALAAGIEACAKFDQPLRITSKGYRDLVTEGDLAAQAAIVAIIRHAFPDHGFLAEEDEPSLPAAGPLLWIIDPIDGTTNYSRTLPLFCISIAAVSNQPPITVDDILAAVIYDPIREEMFTAVAGGQSRLNGRSIQVSSISDLSLAAIGTDWNRTEELRQATLDTVTRLIHKVDGVSCLKSAALALAYVAAGRLDAYFNYQLMPWDVAAAALIIQQAGGFLGDATGKPLSLLHDPLTCLGSNRRLHHDLVNHMAVPNNAS